MAKVLLVTNDFPPTVGGIQSYLRDFVDQLDPSDVVVFASTQDEEAAREYDASVPYTVVRWPRKMMLPTPPTARKMAQLIKKYGIEVVWFGAAAPLALMASAARKAGAHRVVASTHGHEVGWSMLPGARQCLRRIGNTCDVVTYISEYTLRRFRSAFGSHPRYVRLPSGVDTQLFTPLSPKAEGKTVVCMSRLVPRKGQDSLIAAMPAVLRQHPDARLVLVGGGSYEKALRRRAADLGHSVQFLGRLPFGQMLQVLREADVFAMPARTRGWGLDVEGLGIVYLEAQACGIPVIAGNSGGAPETVTSETGIVVNGRDQAELESVLVTLLDDAALRHRLGSAGRQHVETCWTWRIMGARLREVLYTG